MFLPLGLYLKTCTGVHWPLQGNCSCHFFHLLLSFWTRPVSTDTCFQVRSINWYWRYFAKIASMSQNKNISGGPSTHNFYNTVVPIWTTVLWKLWDITFYYSKKKMEMTTNIFKRVIPYLYLLFIHLYTNTNIWYIHNWKLQNIWQPERHGCALWHYSCLVQFLSFLNKISKMYFLLKFERKF